MTAVTESPDAGVRAVALGGGHGLSRSLQALARAFDHVTAVVTAADDGGSSGRLRRDLGVVPPGDLRMALAALSPASRLVDVLQYRFDRGELDGHSLGNLFVVALEDLHDGDVVAALDEAAALLGIRGRVLPCTTTPVWLHAQTGDGDHVDGQSAVAGTQRVERVWLEPADAPGTPAALEAIAAADLLVLGPGSLYTSLLPNLLVTDVADAVRAAEAPVVYVANLREQPGETEGMTLGEHLDAVLQHVPGLDVTHVVVHDGSRPNGPGRALRADAGAISRAGIEVVTADLLDGDDGHDPAALAAVLRDLVR
ncbi:MAG: uridine diphosphate-N-acetylglucosamine-binding protein YvcK [Actinobacteria bacterium]|nr:uridine diphosphate-N-acetylglucosamine-binding protein YvcK [Actinomycetota bacterium]